MLCKQCGSRSLGRLSPHCVLWVDTDAFPTIVILLIHSCKNKFCMHSTQTVLIDCMSLSAFKINFLLVYPIVNLLFFTLFQRQVLIQLARCLEWTVNPPPPNTDTPKSVVKPNVTSDNLRSPQPQESNMPGTSMSAMSSSATNPTVTSVSRQSSLTSSNRSTSRCSSIPDIK